MIPKLLRIAFFILAACVNPVVPALTFSSVAFAQESVEENEENEEDLEEEAPSRPQKSATAIDYASAQRYAEEAQKGSTMPLVMNSFVFERMNHWLENKGRKKWLRDSLRRMAEVEPIFQKHAQKYRLPDELKYLPVIESAYRNEIWGGRLGGGIWALMPLTARRHGLVVNKTVDERLNLDKSTRAALRVLREYHRIFHNWHLTLRAYNEGPALVKRRIRRWKTSDPWKLEELSPTHSSYVQNFLAVVIIARTPALLK